MTTNIKRYFSIGMVAIAAVVVSFLIYKPVSLVSHRSVPIFIGEEVTIQKIGVSAQKAVPLPVQPQVSVPLPIIPPKISYSVLPEYPVSALEQGIEGTVLLSVYIGLNGSPDRVEVKSSSGVADFDQAAVTSVSQWKFSPAIQGGEAIASWFEIPVRFILK